MSTDLGKISVTPKGAYNSSVVYERLDIVSDSGKSYLSRIDSNNKPLTDDTAWQLLVEGGSGGGDITDADVKEKYENNPNTNAFTDAEKVKLASLENFDDSAIQTELDTKVDKVAGKELSTNDYTTYEKNKLSGIQEGAEVNVNADWNATSGDAQILNKPTEFPPSLHTHTIADVNDLQTALNGKEPIISIGTTSQYFRGDKTWQIIDKSTVGLNNVDNTSDAEKNTATVVLKNKTIDGGTY